MSEFTRWRQQQMQQEHRQVQDALDAVERIREHTNEAFAHAEKADGSYRQGYLAAIAEIKNLLP